MKKLNQSSYNTTEWSGGTTTELFISPEGSNFKERNFDFRLSIATIEVSSSDFTQLPETNRTLLLLEGELKLIHENHHESFLMPFSQDTFDGGWNTHSIGIAKDFNLMTKGKTKGNVHVIDHDYIMESKASQVICYNYQADAKINNEKLHPSELLIIDDPSEPINFQTNGKLVVVEIFFS